MQSTPLDPHSEVTMMKLLSKIQMHEAQKTFLSETINNRTLLESKVISSLQPSVGRMFTHENLENRKKSLLLNTRKKLMQLAIEEKDLELVRLNSEFDELKKSFLQQNENTTPFLTKLEMESNKQTRQINMKMNKKLNFHLQGQHEVMEFTKPKKQVKQKRRWTQQRKMKNRAIYNNKQKRKKEEKINAMVKKLKDENVVVNLSDEELPKEVYVFLAKGLGFVPTPKLDIQDLKYDTSEFIRKLSWRAFFKANPELSSGGDYSPLHQDIKVSSFTSPIFAHPLLDNIKTKLFGWIANHVPATPKSNLTLLEIQGKTWLSTKIK